MTAQLRGEVRAFLAEQRTAGTFTPSVDSWLSGRSLDDMTRRKPAAQGGGMDEVK